MVIFAQTGLQQDFLKTTSSLELVAFFVLVLLVVSFLIIRHVLIKRRSKRMDGNSLLELCITTNHLEPEEAVLLRLLARRVGVRRVLKDYDTFLQAVDRYMYKRANRIQEAAAAELALFEQLGARINFLKHDNFRSRMIPMGALIKIRISERGLFSAAVTANRRKGIWLSLPRWALPEAVLRNRRKVILYY